LRAKVFPDLRLALVHGRLKDKDDVMRRFKAGESDVLVATAVVEVGVDVPNATVMLIEGAERFGLAQLHQFRGRVGRGSAQSSCLLLAEDASKKSMERLQLLAQEHDGFRLAAEDMRLRGAGELLGARQHGMSDQAMEGLGRPELLSEVREEAERVLETADAELLRQGHVDVVTTANQRWQHPPFAGELVDGWVWGRGALDMKSGLAMMAGALLHCLDEGRPPAGDVVLCSLADEEAGGIQGAQFLVEKHPQLFSGIRHGLGEGGGATQHLGGRAFYPIMVAEKRACRL